MSAKSILEADGKAILNYHLTRAPVIKPTPLPASSTHNPPSKLASLYFAADADIKGVLDQAEFWRTVAECATGYAASVPHLADRLRRHDLFAPEFTLSCLNRLQLRNNQQMVDLSDPSAALQFAGTLVNPLAPYAPR